MLLVERREVHARLADACHGCRTRNRRRFERLHHMPRHARVAARKHLRTMLLLPRKQQIGSVIGVGRKHVRANAGAASAHRREIAPDGLAAQAMPHHQIFFQRDGVKLARDGIAMAARLRPMVRRVLHREQFALRLRRNRRAFQLLRPRIDQPCAVWVRSIRAEEEAEIAPVSGIRSHARRDAAHVLLILKLPRIDPYRIIKMLEKASRHRLKPHRRSLACDQRAGHPR